MKAGRQVLFGPSVLVSYSGLVFVQSERVCSAVFGPKLGTRAMVQSRFSWG